GPVGCALDEVEIARVDRVGPEAAPEELAAALDDGQEVVEVVGDAAGELPDRLHLLRLTNLSLELLPLADVSERDDRPDQLPVFGADRRAGVLDREARAIPPPKDFVLPPLHLALANCGVHRTVRPRQGIIDTSTSIEIGVPSFATPWVS